MKLELQSRLWEWEWDCMGIELKAALLSPWHAGFLPQSAALQGTSAGSWSWWCRASTDRLLHVCHFENLPYKTSRCFETPACCNKYWLMAD